MGSFLEGGGSVLNQFDRVMEKEAQGGENNSNLDNLWAYEGGGNGTTVAQVFAVTGILTMSTAEVPPVAAVIGIVGSVISGGILIYEILNDDIPKPQFDPNSLTPDKPPAPGWEWRTPNGKGYRIFPPGEIQPE